MSIVSSSAGKRDHEGPNRATAMREVVALAGADVEADEFFAGLLNRAILAVSGKAGAIWLKDNNHQVQLQVHANIPEVIPNSPEALAEHASLIAHVFTTGNGTLVQPHQRVSDDGKVGNATDFILLFGLLKRGDDMIGLVEVFVAAGGPPALTENAARFLQQLCAVGSNYLKEDDHQKLAARQSLWKRLDEFTRKVHYGLDSSTIAFTLANEARRFIECDRVTVAFWYGRTATIKALSGQDTFDARANAIRLLTNLATAVAKAGDRVWYDGHNADLPPQIEAAAQEYVDDSHATLVAVLPLRRPSSPHEDPNTAQAQPVAAEPVIGILIVESFTLGALTPGLRDRVDVISHHSRLALANALDHESLFLLPLWRMLGKSRALVETRRLPKTLLIAGGILAVLLALLVIRVDFTVESKGTLEPVTKRDIFAPHDGFVKTVTAEHGDVVDPATPLLSLDSTELSVKIHELEGRWKTTMAEIQSLNKARLNVSITGDEGAKLAGQVAERHATRRSLESQLALCREQKEQMQVTSPLAGQVVTWQVRDRLVNRPVQRGQVLLTVADLNADWELELQVPENHIGIVAEAQHTLSEDRPVTFILASRPGQSFTGTIKSVHTTADIHGEEGNTVLVRVQLDKSQLPTEVLRPGVSVTAKILCGRSSLGYAWFHDVGGWFEKMWFKIF